MAKKADKEDKGPIFDLLEKISDKESTVSLDVEEFGGKFMGRSFKVMGKMNITLGTLKTPKK